MQGHQRPLMRDENCELIKRMEAVCKTVHITEQLLPNLKILPPVHQQVYLESLFLPYYQHFS